MNNKNKIPKKVQNRFNNKVNEYMQKDASELSEYAQEQSKLPSKHRISNTDFAALEFVINIKQQQQKQLNEKRQISTTTENI